MKNLFENWREFQGELTSMLLEAQKPQIKSQEKDITLYLPKLRISEQWGTPGSNDRQIIEMFTSKIGGVSLKEKIKSLNSFVADCDAKCANAKDVSEILASLVFLDALASVIYDFNPMTGGFLFESLMAALLGGTAEQIATKGGMDQDVTDIVDNLGRPMSLKFFFEGGSQYIKGSRSNLRKSIVDAGQPMIYLVGLKNRAHKDGKVLALDFYEFSVGSPRDGIEGDYTVDDIGGWNGLPVSYIIGAKPRGRPRKGEEGKPRKRSKTSYHLGTIDFGSRDEMVKVAQNYTERLGSVLYELYEHIALLSNNVNTYFLEAPNAKESALQARQNAEALRKETDEL